MVRKRQAGENIITPWEVVEGAYDHYADMTDDIDRNPTRDELWAIVDRLIEQGYDPFADRDDLPRFKQKSLLRTKVNGWFKRRDLYSPYVDEVALERAMRFEPAAIDGLTPRERGEFYDRLSTHPDPFGFANEPPNLPHSDWKGPRARAFFHLGNKRQDIIRHGMERRGVGVAKRVRAS